jgi:hypothetical protein
MMDTLNEIAAGQYYLCRNPEDHTHVTGRMNVTDVKLVRDQVANEWRTVVVAIFIDAQTGERKVREMTTILGVLEWLEPLTAQEWDTYEMIDIWETDDDPYKVVRDAEDQPPDAYVKDWNPDDALGKTLTAMLEEVIGLQESFDDIAAFHAPSECGKDVMRGYKRRMREIILDHFLTLEDFCDEYNTRVDPAWRMANAMPEAWYGPSGEVYVE